MRRSRSGYLSVEENEEPEEEVRSNTISNIETVIHLVKGNIGTISSIMKLTIYNDLSRYRSPHDADCHVLRRSGRWSAGHDLCCAHHHPLHAPPRHLCPEAREREVWQSQYCSELRANELCRNVKFLDYADTAEAAFVSAGGAWAKYSVFMRRLINIFLCMSQIGSNAVYILFVAQNILPVGSLVYI